MTNLLAPMGWILPPMLLAEAVCHRQREAGGISLSGEPLNMYVLEQKGCPF